jgi:hypothetical protein
MAERITDSILDVKPSRNRTAKVRDDLEERRKEFDDNSDTETGKAVQDNVAALLPIGKALLVGKQAVSTGLRAVHGATPKIQASARAAIEEAKGTTRRVGRGSSLAQYPAPVGRGRGVTFTSRAEQAEGVAARESAAEAAPYAAIGSAASGHALRNDSDKKDKKEKKEKGSTPIDLSGEDLDQLKADLNKKSGGTLRRSGGGGLGVGKALRGYGAVRRK